MTKELEIKINGQYIKDLSFENNQAPQIYAEKDINPSINVAIDLNATKLQKSIYEVELIVDAKAICNEKDMFNIQLVYAGIFSIENIEEEDEELKDILFIYCPSILFPYARRILSDTTRDASMPPLMLEPINFRALYDSKKHTLK